jgi:beta-galactosidase GanA
LSINKDTEISAQDGVIVRKRGDYIFIMNFTSESKKVTPQKNYTDALTGDSVCDEFMVEPCSYRVFEEK